MNSLSILQELRSKIDYPTNSKLFMNKVENMNFEYFALGRQSLISLVATVLINCSSAPESVNEILGDLREREFSGSILVSQQDELLFSSGFGAASCDGSASNSADTVFAIGSITKMFTDVALYRLESQGLVDLSARLSDYLEGVPDDKIDISLKQLMQHRSGLDAYHETDPQLGDFEQMDLMRARDEIFSRPLLFTPGSRESYSNSGYTLLAMVIQSVSGQNYIDYLRRELFAPAGMTRTGFWGERFSEMAATENEILGCSSPADWEYSWVLVGNGGMVSTAKDLMRWIRALRNEVILDAETMQQSGLARMLASEFGSAGGSSQHDFNAAIEFDGESDVLVVAISNTDAVEAETFARDLLQAVLMSHRENRNY